MIPVPLVRLPHGEGLPLPAYATPQSAGVDLMAAVEATLTLKPLERHLIPTGLSIALPEGYEAQIRPRSGLALKHGLTVLNSPGTIDSDYRGEVKVLLINLGGDAFVIERGLRMAQLILMPVAQLNWREVESHQTTCREGGFGSTGLKHAL